MSKSTHVCACVCECVYVSPNVNSERSLFPLCETTDHFRLVGTGRFRADASDQAQIDGPAWVYTWVTLGFKMKHTSYFTPGSHA